jgi:hypothetical protein
MKRWPNFEELSAAERRVVMLIEGRRSERIIKLHWLTQQRVAVRKFLDRLGAEVAALRAELREDHGLSVPEVNEELRAMRKSAAK